MSTKKTIRLLGIVGLVLMGIGVIQYVGGDIISLEKLQHYHKPLEAFVETHFILSSLIYVGTFVGLSALSLPVITSLLLLGGLLFPLAWALILGYISFFLHCWVMVLGIRYLFRERIMNQYKEQLEKINKKIEEKGIYYVIFLRLSLLLPSQVVNMAAGLTTMNGLLFSLVSMLSSIPIITMLIYSGRLLATINTIWDLYSHQNLIILLSLAGSALVVLWITNKRGVKKG